MKNQCTAIMGFVLVFMHLNAQASTGFAQITLELQQQPFQVELAISNQQRRLGLMNRPDLPPNSAMLLVYPQMGMHNIWMKNVAFPLHLVWLDDTGSVLHQQVVPPCLQDPCPVYSAQQYSRYVLELFPGKLLIHRGEKLIDVESLQSDQDFSASVPE